MVTGEDIGRRRHGSEAWKSEREPRPATRTEEHPNLDATICDRERAESILDGVQLFFWDDLVEKLDEFAVIYQLHYTTTLEEARIIRKDTARLLIISFPIPRKDALVVRCTDDLQLKTVE